MRMVLEVVMLFALVGGLFFAMKVLAKENRQEKAITDDQDKARNKNEDVN